MKVVDAGQQADADHSGSARFVAVAALCCCTWFKIIPRHLRGRVGVHAHLVDRKGSNCHAAGRVGMRQTCPSLPYGRPGPRQLIVWTLAWGVVGQHLGGLGQSFLSSVAALSGGDYPISLELPSLCGPVT